MIITRRGKFVFFAGVALAITMLVATCLLPASRIDVGPERLALIDVSSFPILEKYTWTRYSSAFDNNYTLQWRNENADLLLVEVWSRGSSLQAIWVYLTERTAPRYSRQYPDLVKMVDAPSNSADLSQMFCGHIGKSPDDSLDDCRIWGYWAMYGQYVLYLETYGLRLSLDDFQEVAKAFDDHVTQVLSGSPPR